VTTVQLRANQDGDRSSRRTVGRMDDRDNPQWDSYSMVLTRDGPGWQATLRADGLPGDGRFIRDRTIAALNARTWELFEDLPDRSCWHLEYSSAASPVALHEWSMSRLSVSQVNEKNERDGHALASALAADGASVSDIAEATHTSYLEAAWMLAAQLPPHRLVGFAGQVRADQRHYYRWGAARLLRVIAADKIRALARRRALINARLWSAKPVTCKQPNATSTPRPGATGLTGSRPAYRSSPGPRRRNLSESAA
jgi:hypothetical protein